MGFSLTVAVAAIGVAILIVVEIFLGGLLPTVSLVNEAYDDLKNRLVFQDETSINITEITNVGLWDNGWDYRKLILIDHDQVADDLTNFPILINITDADLATHAQADGDDIMFISGDNTTQYNHEIENYTSATGHLVAWVNVTSVFDDMDTWFFMYYG